MRRRQRLSLLLFIGILLGWHILVPNPGLTQSGYELTRSVIGGGGGTASGGAYQLTGTVGQPDAGQISGGDYTLGGGFWGGGGAASGQGGTTVYLPLVIK